MRLLRSTAFSIKIPIFSRGIFLVLLVVFLHFSSAGTTTPESHTVQVSDLALAKQIEASGGRLIADYDSYRLYEVTNLPARWRGHPRVELRDDYQTIFLHAGAINTRELAGQKSPNKLSTFTGKRLHLVQFAGPVLPKWREELLAAGMQIISYIPANSYLVYGDINALAQVENLTGTNPHFQWQGRFEDRYKIHPLARNQTASGKIRDIGTDYFAIQLVADAEANVATIALLERLKLEPFQRRVTAGHYVNLIVRLDPAQIELVSAQPEVVSIMPYFTRKKLCERQDQIVAGNLAGDAPNGPGYLAWLTNAGFSQAQFDASAFVVDIVDSGVDNGTTLPGHFGLYRGGIYTNASRVIFNRYEATQFYYTNSLQGCDGHGTLNAHIVAGYDDYSGFPFTDDSGFHFGLGVCPFVSIGSSVIFDSVDENYFYYPNYDNLESEAYENGVRISNNSWGGRGSQGVYDVESQDYDGLVRNAQPTNSTYVGTGNQEMVIVFAAGNDGSDGQTINTPGTAKNVITVGAADNVQVFDGSDGSGIGDDQADNANAIASFSSRGPCADGRAKPDLVAPGTHVSGGVFQATNDFINFPDGIAGDCYDGGEVSGGPNSIFWPTNQQFYTASSGTSHSTPCVSGGCALVLQYFLNNFTNLPSPAMTKAFLMNSARYLDGYGANDTFPSPNQGMGEMNLGMAFDGAPRIVRDQIASDLFTNSGQVRAFTGVVANTNHPFRITLAWTDAPGGLSGNAYNNDLDLSVTIGGNTYKGNVFNNALSVTGGAADAVDNVESVFLPAGTTGAYTVLIRGTSINSVGVPNTNDALCQDFALTIYNAVAQPMPVVIMPETDLAAESCYPTNGVIDPGESVTVNFVLQNIGSADVSNLVVTLATNSAIVCANNATNFGILTGGGLAVTIPFTFTANGACGSSLSASLNLQAGTNNLGNPVYNFTLGQFVSATIFTENFDELIVPNLPTNWSTIASGGQTNWISTTNFSDTPPVSLFAADPASPGIAELYSPPIAIVSAQAQLTFNHYYDLEAQPSESATPDNAYDGGVLEIQVGTNGFVDILTAGGSFVSGGYNSVIEPHDDNALGTRAVWSGNSGGFIATVVSLPAAAAGQTIQLRWRCGTDTGNINGGTGWYVDTVAIQDGYYSCCTPLATPVLMNLQLSPTNFVYSFLSHAGQTYTAQYSDELPATNWVSDQFISGNGTVISVTNSLISPARFYRLISP